MEASEADQNDPPPGSRSRAPRLAGLIVGAVLGGALLGTALVRLGAGAAPPVRVIRLSQPLPTRVPPAPPPVDPTPATRAPPMPPPVGIELQSETRPEELPELRSLRNAPRAGAPSEDWLVGELPTPQRVEIRLFDPDSERQEILHTAYSSSPIFRTRVPYLPVDRTWELHFRDLDDPGRGLLAIPVRGRPVPATLVFRPEEELRAVRGVPEGVVALEGKGTLVWHPSEGTGGPRRIDTGLELVGVPWYRRDVLVARTSSGTMVGWSLITGRKAWTYRGPGPLEIDPVAVPPFGLITQVHRIRSGGSALEHLEASTGIPMWKAPIVLRRPLPPGAGVAVRGLNLLVPGQGGGAAPLDAFDGRLLPEILDPEVGPVSTTPALSASGRWGAVGTVRGEMRSFDLAMRRREPESEPRRLRNGEFRKGIALGPVEHLQYIGEDRVLAAAGQELILVNSRGAQLWRAWLPSPRAGPPAVLGRRVLVSLEDGSLLVLRKRDGLELEHREVGKLVPGSLHSHPGAALYWGLPGEGVFRLEEGGAPRVEGARSGPLGP